MKNRFFIVIAILALLLLQNVIVADVLDNFINDSRWSNGTTWGSSQRPKVSGWSCKGCCAYCADFVKYCFNGSSQRSGTLFYGASNIRQGDVLYFTPDHWVAVIRRNGNNLYTAEGNWGSKVAIGWNYTIVGDQLHRGGTQFRTFHSGYHNPY